MKKYILIIAVILAAGVTGCKKDFLSLETNPNFPSVTTPQLTLAGALTTAPTIKVGDYIIYDIWSAYWSWNGGVVPPAQVFQYQFGNTDFSPAIWTDLFSNATNFNNLINASAKDPSLAHFQAIGMIMKAWDFENLVDNFNDVPYSDAFKPSTVLFPKYDKGADIYADLAKQLDAAIALAGKDGTNPGTSDTMYGGDMTKWIQFANTLKLRLAIRESNLSGSTLKAGLPASGSAYITADALVNPGYANTAGQQNPYYGNFVLDANGNPGGNSNIFRANAFSIEYLRSTDDTLRLARMFSKVLPAGSSSTVPSIYHGNVFGDAVNILGTKNTSGAGPAYSKGANQSSIMMLAAESYFLQAEAVARGYITGDAADLYSKGVTADFEYLGLTDVQATTYLASHAYPASGSLDARVKAIITQKWIAFLNGYDGFEAFNEYRRTGYPVLPSSVDPAALSTHLPSRIFYPLSEVSSNPDQYKAAGGASINQFTSQIFWDTRTGL